MVLRPLSVGIFPSGRLNLKVHRLYEQKPPHFEVVLTKFLVGFEGTAEAGLSKLCSDSICCAQPPVVRCILPKAFCCRVVRIWLFW